MAWEIVTSDEFVNLKLTDAGPQYYIGMADSNNNIIGGLTSYNAQDFELIVDDNDISVGTSESDFNTTFPWINNLGFEINSKTNDSMQMTPWGIAPNSYDEYTLDFRIYLKNKKTNQLSDVAIHIHLTDLEEAGGTQKIIKRWFYVDLLGGDVQYLSNVFLFFTVTSANLYINTDTYYYTSSNVGDNATKTEGLLLKIGSYCNTNIIDSPFMYNAQSYSAGDLPNGTNFSNIALTSNLSRVHIGLCWKSKRNDTTENPECYFEKDVNTMLGSYIIPNGTLSQRLISENELLMPNAILNTSNDSLLKYNEYGLKTSTFNKCKNYILQCWIGSITDNKVKFIKSASANVNINNASEDSLNPTLLRY